MIKKFGTVVLIFIYDIARLIIQNTYLYSLTIAAATM